MRDMVLDQIPANVRAFLDKIEDFAGLEITFTRNPRPVSPTDPNPDGPASMTWEHRATILLRTEDIDPQGILHELLHIHRYWVEGIPQIMPATPHPPADHWRTTSSIETDLARISHERLPPNSNNAL